MLYINACYLSYLAIKTLIMIIFIIILLLIGGCFTYKEDPNYISPLEWYDKGR